MLPLPQAGHVLASDPWHLLSSGALFFQVLPGHSLSSSKSVQVTFPDTLFNVAAVHPHYPLLPGLFSFQFCRSVMSNSLESHVWWPARLLHPWDFPGKNTGVVCHFLCQGIFPAQGSNPGLPNCRQTLHHLSYQESPINLPTKQKETHRHKK